MLWKEQGKDSSLLLVRREILFQLRHCFEWMPMKKDLAVGAKEKSKQ